MLCLIRWPGVGDAVAVFEVVGDVFQLIVVK